MSNKDALMWEDFKNIIEKKTALSDFKAIEAREGVVSFRSHALEPQTEKQ